jgi:hypothetical protein
LGRQSGTVELGSFKEILSWFAPRTKRIVHGGNNDYATILGCGSVEAVDFAVVAAEVDESALGGDAGRGTNGRLGCLELPLSFSTDRTGVSLRWTASLDSKRQVGQDGLRKIKPASWPFGLRDVFTAKRLYPKAQDRRETWRSRDSGRTLGNRLPSRSYAEGVPQDDDVPIPQPV